MRFSGHENSAADTDYIFLSKLGVLLRNKTIAAPTQTRCAVSLFWLSAHRFFFPFLFPIPIPNTHKNAGSRNEQIEYVLVAKDMI